MKFETFVMERTQSIWEHKVEINLAESGVAPLRLDGLLEGSDISDTYLGYPQTNGTEGLREAVSDLYAGSDADNVVITNGTAEANYISTMTTLEPGDEAIIMLPNYMQVFGLARSLGATVIPLPLHEDQGWAVDPDELRKLVTNKTKLIAVCNPNNPTGAVMKEDTMREIAKIAGSVGAWILSDEVYLGAELDGDVSATYWGWYDRLMVTAGLSKAYALPGLRVGWVVSDRETTAKLWSYKDYTSIAIGALSDRLAQVALEPARRTKILQRTRNILQKQLPLLDAFVQRHGNRVSWVPPTAGAIGYIRYTWDIASTELMERLRDEKGVFVVPGDHFNMDHYLRIGYGYDPGELETGLARCSELLETLS
jgi:aspartate/methionine/tyrosine aminotransferase